MGGYISLAATRGCRATLIFTTAALACCVLLLSFAGGAAAAPAAEKLVPANPDGPTEPSGLAVTPDGRLWASDAMLGVCRVNLETGALEQDRFCAPEAAHAEPPAGVEEPPPADPDRPTTTFQIAFDSNGCGVDTPPAREDLCNFYVAEGSSGGSGVWRMHWNSETGRIDKATKIFTDAADQRVMGIALAPGGAVDFSSKRNSQILRIENAATAQPGAGTTFVGITSSGAEASSLANLGGKTYIADGGHLSVIDRLGTTATQLPDPPAGAVVSSVAAGPDGVLFVGTSRPQLTDEVLSFRAGGWVPGAYDHGFANVTAMALAPGGDLYIAHDPTAALSPGVDQTGQGEVFKRLKTEPNPPDVSITERPEPVVRSGAYRFAFEATPATGTASFRCTFDDGEPFACDGGSFVTPVLGEGVHRFTVRAAKTAMPGAGDWGVARQVGFTVDDTKPEVAIDPRTATTAVGGSLRLRFTASDVSPVAFTCAIDGGEPFGCGSPEDLALALGDHTITVRAIDAAGNESDPVDWQVTAVPAPPVPVVTVPTGGTAAAPQAPATSAPARTQPAARRPRIDIDVPCVAVSPSRADRARFALSGRRAKIRYRSPAKARYAKFTLRSAAGGRRDRPIVETLGYRRVRRAGEHSSSMTLTRGQRALVRRGRMRLAVAYGTCRTQVGRWQWISDSDSTRKGKR